MTTKILAYYNHYIQYPFNQNQNYAYAEQNSIKEKERPDLYKNTPQIKLGDLHIYGIKSIEPFKDNKYIIKAVNRTFALPKDKLNEAEKINFTSELMK
mgnify:CR=1 FL=1